MRTRDIVVGYDRSPGAKAAVAWALDEAVFSVARSSTTPLGNHGAVCWPSP